MATAPAPGAGRRREESKRAKVITTITIRGESKSCAFGNLPIRERALIRDVTGLPFERWMARLEEDSLMVMWWVARRQSGERGLSFDDVEAGWFEDLTGDEVEIVEDDGEAEDPQP
jgi:hypothetical protein